MISDKNSNNFFLFILIARSATGWQILLPTKLRLRLNLIDILLPFFVTLGQEKFHFNHLQHFLPHSQTCHRSLCKKYGSSKK